MTVPKPDTHDPLCYYATPPAIEAANCPRCAFIASVRADERARSAAPAPQLSEIQRWAEIYDAAYGHDILKPSYAGQFVKYADHIAYISSLSDRIAELEAAPLTLAQLEALPVGSVVLDRRNAAWQKYGTEWRRVGEMWSVLSDHLLRHFGPVRLLHRGGQSD